MRVGQMLNQPVGGDLCTNLSVVICRSSVGREEELYGRYGNNDSDNCRRYSSDGSAFRFFILHHFVNTFM